MAFRFGRQPFQFDASAFQEPMQGVTYQTASDPIPTRRNALQSTLAPPSVGGIQSPQMRRFSYNNEQMAEEEENKDPEFDFGQMFKNRPTFEATQRYIKALESRPDLQEYKPNMGQNIFGALAGVGEGLRGAPGKDIYGSVERIRYGPYQRALQDWEGRMEGLGSGAEAEQKKAEVDTRWMTSMGNLYNQKSLAENRIDASERGWANIDVKREAQQASIDKAVLQGWQVVKGVDGRIKAVNPRDPDADPVDLGVDTGAEIAGRRADTANRAVNVREQQGNRAANQRDRALGQGDTRNDIAQQRVMIAAEAARNTGRNIDSLIDNRSFQQRMAEGTVTEAETALSPQDRQAVKSMALQDVMIANPQFRGLLDDTGQFLEDAADDPLFEQFMMKYNRAINDNTTKRTTQTTRRPRVTNPAGGVAAPNAPAPAAPRSNGLPTGILDWNQLPR